MSLSDYHVHGGHPDANPGVDQDFAEPHMDDPRIGASPAEIAHWNKVETENGQLTPKVISQNTYTTLARTSPLSSTSETSA